MTKANFLDNTTINVVAHDGEAFILKAHMPVAEEMQKPIARLLVKSFKKNFSDDKLDMVYWVLMDMMANARFSFSYGGSDRSKERERIGTRIRQLREGQGIEAKKLARVINIDAANLSRIEQGKYSAGFDILTRIADALDVKVDLVEKAPS